MGNNSSSSIDKGILKFINSELENRVQERTAELLELNKRLLYEIEEHKI